MLGEPSAAQDKHFLQSAGRTPTDVLLACSLKRCLARCTSCGTVQPQPAI